MSEPTTTPRENDQTAGTWVITCPGCGHSWKVVKEEIHAGAGWMVCPSCQDAASRRLPEDAR